MSDNVDIRVRLQDGKVVAAEAKAISEEVDGIGNAAQRSGRKIGGFNSVSRKMGPVLSSVARYAGYAVLGMGAFTVGVSGFATYTGLKFNATMEENAVAFKNFLGSTKAANKYLGELYHIAAVTPFEFTQLTEAAKGFLAFGFSAKEAKTLLMEVGDAASGLGKGTEGIDRMVLALGQMKAKEKIQSNEMLQLTELGLPAWKYLAEGLHMSTSQVFKEVEKGNVRIGEGLKALRAGMRRDYAGMSIEQGKTLKGQLSTLHDNVTQMLGKLTKPVFNWLKRDVLPAVNAALPGIQKWLMGAIAKVPEIFTAIKGGVQDFLSAVKPAKPFVENVLWPLIKGLAIGFGATVVLAVKAGVPAFKALMVALGWVGTAAKPLKGVIEGIGIAVQLVSKAGLIVAPILIHGLVAAFKWTVGAGNEVWSVMKGIARVAKNVYNVIAPLVVMFVRINTWGLRLAFNIGTGLVKAFGSFAGMAIPVVKDWISKVGGVLLGLGGWFFNIGKTLVSKFVKGLMGLGSAMISAFGSGAGLAGDIGRSIIQWINDNTPFGDSIHVGMPGPIPDIDFTLPALANGGIITGHGSVLVGDAGPEILTLPRGARVDPLPRKSGGGGDGGGGGFSERLIIVRIDGKEIGRHVEQYASDKQNRR